MTKKKVVRNFWDNWRELFQDFFGKIYFPKIFAPPIFVTKIFAPQYLWQVYAPEHANHYTVDYSYSTASEITVSSKLIWASSDFTKVVLPDRIWVMCKLEEFLFCFMFVHSFILDISIVPLQVHYYSESDCSIDTV